jgi:ATP-binding cassette subfamily C (CFTR/MRP) protein 4
MPKNVWQQEFDHHQDVHASATYLLKTIVYSFSFWVDMMCLMYIVLIIFSFLLFESRKLNQRGRYLKRIRL